MLLTECEWAGAEVRLETTVNGVGSTTNGYHLQTTSGTRSSESLVVACGGLSIPTMGATSFGYDIARQFGLTVLPARAGLVPFTLHPELKKQLAPLAGVSCPVDVHCNNEHFREPMLVTHRGLSGPAMLQISSFWQPGDRLSINMLPAADIEQDLYHLRKTRPQSTVAQYLIQHLPKRFAQALNDIHGWAGPLQGFRNSDIEQVAQALGQWTIKPAGTEGYRTAEVTLGGVDTRQLSSRTMAVVEKPDLYFIGEVVDVTGHLGGHNFQWAWASGVAAGNNA